MNQMAKFIFVEVASKVFGKTEKMAINVEQIVSLKSAPKNKTEIKLIDEQIMAEEAYDDVLSRLPNLG